MPKSPYDVLGLPETATKIEAERAWKKAVRRLHPDRHPEDQRDALTEELALINQAWAQIQRGSATQVTERQDDLQGRMRMSQEIPLTYSARDPLIRSFLDALREEDLKETQSYFWKNLLPSLLRFRLPKRPALHIALCAGVEIQGRTLSYLFHAPLPAGRVAMIIPRLRANSLGVNVMPNHPEALFLEPNRPMAGIFSPFDPDAAQKLGLDNITVSLPGQILDVTKSFPLSPPEGFASIYYHRG
jgi:hypothetical protein